MIDISDLNYNPEEGVREEEIFFPNRKPGLETTGPGSYGEHSAGWETVLIFGKEVSRHTEDYPQAFNKGLSGVCHLCPDSPILFSFPQSQS